MRIIRILSLLFFLVLSACLSDNEGDFDTQPTDGRLLPSSYVLDIMNQKFVNPSSSTSCFKFNYPITISNSSSNKFVIQNDEGFMQMALSSNNFFALSIVLPFEVNNNPIRNNIEFKEQMKRCNIKSFDEVLKEKISNCYDFQYPINIGKRGVNIQNTIFNNSDFLEYLNGFKAGDELAIAYPVEVISLDGKKDVFGNKNIYTVLNECNASCNAYSISQNIQSEEEGVSVFSINANSSNEIKSIQWFLDNKILPENKIKYETTFVEESNYEVCAVVEFENCLESKRVCTSVQIESNQIPICKKLKIEYDKNQDNAALYRFYMDDASALNFPDALLQWSVNNVVLKDENLTSLDYQFSFEDQYEVCYSLISNECESNSKKCISITITSEDLNSSNK